MVITEYNMSHIDAMEGHEFEHFIAALLRELGYQKVEVTRGSGDQGVDVLAEKDDIRYAVQCKCYGSDLGNTSVQEVNTGKMVYQCHIGVVVTNRYFTQSAREAAKVTGVLLWDRAKLEKMLVQVQGNSDAEILIQQSKYAIELWSGSPLLKRGGIALKDKEWKKAIQFFDRVLNTDPENAEAYLGIVMAEAELSDIDEFMNFYSKYYYKLDEKNLNHVKEFAGPELSAWFIEEDERIEKLEKKRKELIICFKAIKEKKEKELEKSREKKRKEIIVQLASVRDSLKEVVSPIITGGFGHIVGLKARGTVVSAGDNRYGQCNVSGWRDIVAVSCGNCHTVGLKSDGTVVATGDNRYGQCNVSDWRDIVAVVCGSVHTIGLKVDGAVVSAGDNRYGQCNVSGWRGIVAVSCGNCHTFGLKSDGTVVATGDNQYRQCNVSRWRDIVAVFCSDRHTVGLKSDGTVVATGDNECGQCNVSDWRDIIAVSCGDRHTIGLKSDGTVVGFTGEISDWKDIVDIAVTSYDTIIGLKKDGTVVIKVNYHGDQYGVISWTDIVTVTVAIDYIVGLKSDGSVVVAIPRQRTRKTVRNNIDLYNILEWNLLDNLATLKRRQSRAKNSLMTKFEEERRQQDEQRAKLRAESTMKKAALKSERTALSNEIANLKGLFTGKRRREIKARLVEISKEEWNLHRQENNHGE